MGIRFFLTATLLLSSIIPVERAISGEISLSKNIVYFDKNESKRDVVYVNALSKNQNVYFKTVVREVLEPQKELKSTYAELSNPEELGLFVTPNKAIITPSEGREHISIVNINQNLEEERIYRIDVSPVIPPLSPENDHQGRLKILIGYDILVFVQPDNPKMDYEYSFEGNKFYFHNTGNTHITLTNGKQCDSRGDCKRIDEGIVYHDSVVSSSLLPETVSVSYDITLRGVSKEHVTFEKK